MPINTVLTLGQWYSQVSEVFSTAQVTKCTSDQLNDMVAKRIWPELNRRTKTRPVYTSYTKGYVNGFMECKRQGLWQHMEFCYLIDGVLYTTAKQETGKPKLGIDVDYAKANDAPCAHFWIGTDKPFTRLEPIDGKGTTNTNGEQHAQDHD